MEPITDKRTELISIIQYFSRFGNSLNLTTDAENEYTALVESWFSNWKNHDAIRYSDYLTEKKRFGYDGPYGIVLCCEMSELLAQQADFDPPLLKRIDLSDIRTFVRVLNDFIRDTDFGRFLVSAENYFRKLQREYHRQPSQIDARTVLIDYYGYCKAEPRIVLAPLNKGSYAVKVEKWSHVSSIYSIIGMDGIEVFTSGVTDYIDRLSWHEFSHSFVNPLGEVHAEEIGNLRHLFPPIAEKMAQGYNAYPQWPACLDEHIVRGVTARLIRKYKGDEKYRRQLDWDKQQGFIYLEIIDGLLAEYENRRGEFKTFDDFYPKILEGLVDKT